ncbi:hemin ABC transporter substrate-binding protein [Roseovarius sp. M141]|uniref:heme/hemin ABC transporter substrate-binding protein n=1 Tax=Roseovarius sp. M141 TaxID=2583806 RepID=UPI0020CBD3C1|nr:ABC transporter substrate-binding protein [Roseovarius sp. M141]MCQ0091544.1 hemin ABC transporter substrate-binding protein [Roseovarius sp. M141]
MRARLTNRTTTLAGSIAITLGLIVLFGPWHPARAEAPADVVSIGGSVTEIIYALGQQHRIVARDTTSTFPPQAEALPDIGYMRALSPEGVLSVRPALILSEADSGPPDAVDVLRAAGVEFVMLGAATTGEGIATKIRSIGAALDVPDKAGALAAQIEKDMLAATASGTEAAGKTPKRVLFILSTQGGRIMASGTGTAADAMIGLAGGINAITEISGYKPLSDEAITRAAPDVILVMDRGGDHEITRDALLATPAIATTPAAAAGAVIRMDGLYLLGFGPRTPQAVADLTGALYGGG